MKKVSGNTCARKVWAGLALTAGLWKDLDTWRDRAVQPDAMAALAVSLACSKDIQRNADPTQSIAAA